jgi:hypothetical protein
LDFRLLIDQKFIKVHQSLPDILEVDGKISKIKSANIFFYISQTIFIRGGQCTARRRNSARQGLLSGPESSGFNAL